MIRAFYHVTIVLALLTFLNAEEVYNVTVQSAKVKNQRRTIAYFIAWGIYGRKYFPENIPLDSLTHLNYAFANIDASGRIVLGDPYADIDKAYPGDTWDASQQPFRGNFWQINKVLKKKAPHLKTLISVGGWTWSARFSDAALTSASRDAFAASCKEFIDKYGFDGVDLDWEYPVEGGLPTNVYRPEDGVNYNLLLAAVRKAIGKNKLLTIAAPAGPQLTRHLKIKQMAGIIDFVNIMTYDFRGGWSTYTGHQTPLYYPKSAPNDDPDKKLGSTEMTVKYFIKNGMPASKINIGAVMYGRGWLGADAKNNGLYQKFTKVPQGTWDDWTSGATGVFDYKDIKKKLAAGEIKEYWDKQVRAPYGFNPTTGFMVSYDSKRSISAKCNYIKKNKLGGIMFWDLSGDDNNELLNRARSALNRNRIGK